MASPRIILDGGMAYGVIVNGTGVIVINAVPYKLNSVEVARPSSEVIQRNPDGTPAQRRETADIAALTGELQLATQTTAYPAFGQTFSCTVDSVNYGSETWALSPVPASQDNSETGIRVVKITAKKVLVGITVVN